MIESRQRACLPLLVVCCYFFNLHQYREKVEPRVSCFISSWPCNENVSSLPVQSQLAEVQIKALGCLLLLVIILQWIIHSDTGVLCSLNRVRSSSGLLTDIKVTCIYTTNKGKQAQPPPPLPELACLVVVPAARCATMFSNHWFIVNCRLD